MTTCSIKRADFTCRSANVHVFWSVGFAWEALHRKNLRVIPTLTHCSNIVSGILSGSIYGTYNHYIYIYIYSSISTYNIINMLTFYLYLPDILSDVLPGIYSDILSGILSDILPGILFDISSDIPSMWHLALAIEVPQCPLRSGWGRSPMREVERRRRKVGGMQLW